MTKWSLGYQLLKYYVGTIFRLFNKRLVANGLENIPKKKPIIFAPNHQNALIDPLAIIFTSSKQPVFLTRADVFAKPILLKIFTYIKMLPVYRIKDGAANLKNNEYIFNKSVEILEANAPIGLFPEATQTDKRRLRTLKKAVPRIAFMAEEKNDFNLDLQVIPVGIYYDNYYHSNVDIFVNYGKGFTIKKYKERYLENPQKAYTEFREELFDRIVELIIHIRDLEHYHVYENIRLFYRSSMKKKLKLGNSVHDNFKTDKETIAIAEKAFLDGDNNIEVFDNQYNRLERGLKKKGFSILDFDHICPVKTIASSLLLIFAFPIFLFGFLNAIPYYLLTLKFVKKLKTRQFDSSFKFGISAFVFPIMFMIHALIFGLITGQAIWGVYYFFAALISTVVANKYRYLFIKVKKQWAVLFLKWFKNKEFNSIIKTRDSILSFLNTAFGMDN